MQNPFVTANPPPSSRPLQDPSTPAACDYGFKRLIPLLESPAVGAGILAITFFFFIAFLSNVLLAHITPRTLGIVVTVSTFSLLLLLILIVMFL